jgi:hypothetical protein
LAPSTVVATCIDVKRRESGRRLIGRHVRPFSVTEERNQVFPTTRLTSASNRPRAAVAAGAAGAGLDVEAAAVVPALDEAPDTFGMMEIAS